MRVLLLALVALLPLVFALPQPDLIDASNIESMWAQEGELQLRLGFGQFKAQFGKQYESADMEEYRFGLFKQNMQRAAELQKLNPTAQFGATKFADLHPSEFKRQYLNFRPGVSSAALLRRAAEVRKPETKCAASLPTDFDWRAPDGGRPSAITAVKDQGQCGSCWAFSATEELESAWILAGNKPIALAPQQVVSCDGGDGGCNGGDLPTAYAYIEKAGLEAESSYPYKSGGSGDSGKCSYDKSKVVATMKSWKYATPNCEDSCQKQDEDTLKKNIYEAGPAAICVDAEPWQMYQSGVLDASSGCQTGYSDLDHCVQLTGWGRDNSTGQAFWSVRNSWSASWGEQGFIRLLYGANTCGVADEAVQVIIN